MKLLLLAFVLCSCSTYNIIVVADQPFMDKVKADYDSLYMTQAIKVIEDSLKPQACPLYRELPTWHMTQEN